jgi:RNA polymerase sigma-70 factor (ECF subfamily)
MQNDQIIQEILPYKSKFYRFALKIVGNDEDAEDVIQEMLVKVWQKSEQLSEIDNKEAWCMTVTRNLCIDKIRRRKKTRSNDIDEYFSLSDSSPTPDIITEDRESLSIVMKTLNALPDSQKEIIHLRDIEGYTYREISTITGMTEDQVKVNLFRARQKLKHELRNFSY